MTGKHRIIVVTNGYPNPHKPYAGMYLKRHVQIHRNLGFDVTVLHPGDSRRGPFRTPWKHFRLLRRVLGASLFPPFDLVHAHWPFPAGVLGAFLSGLRRKPFVLTSHGSYVDDIEARPAPIRHMVRWALRRADIVIAVGRAHAEQLRRVGGLGPQRVRVIDMGVWLEDEMPTREAARRRLGLPRQQRIVAFMGNLHHSKGADILIRAVARMARSDLAVHAIIGGQGREEGSLRRLIREGSLEDTVSLIGGVAALDVPVWLAAADVCVVPSRSEALGLVPLEAMAVGTPVVAADVGGLRETIRHEHNGLLFPVEDDAELARLLGTLLRDERMRESLARQGRATAASHDLKIKAAEVHGIYIQLLESASEKEPAKADVGPTQSRAGRHE